MRVLLLGDFSGVHRYLKEGLIKNGVQVTLLSDEDGWKKLGGADSCLYGIGIPQVEAASSNVRRWWIGKRQKAIGALAKQADVVQIMCLRSLCYNSCEQLCRDIKSNAKFFSLAGGMDIFEHRAWKTGKYRYYYYDNKAANDIPYNNNTPRQQILNDTEEYIFEQLDGVIPLLYEYEEPYREQPKRRRTIRMPVNTDRITYRENTVKGKIVFSCSGWGNRADDKGTKYILEAMRIIQEKYPHDVECRITTPVPLNQYLEDITEANVIIDQCFSYGYGMSAVQSMARGRIVMSGAEPETLKALSLESCPIVNILPSVEDIVAKMEQIIEQRNQIPQWGIESRRHIERYHNYVDIAKEFLDCWAE